MGAHPHGSIRIQAGTAMLGHGCKIGVGVSGRTAGDVRISGHSGGPTRTGLAEGWVAIDVSALPVPADGGMKAQRSAEAGKDLIFRRELITLQFVGHEA